MALETTGPGMGSMAALIASRLAKQGVNLATPPTPKTLVEPAGLKPDMPNVITFLGPSGACIWLNGEKSKKRFSRNGVYLTDSVNEAAQLRTMSGVTELSPELAMGVI